MTGLKHTVECHCTLPQYRTNPKPPYHRFIVFSIIDDGDAVIPKHASCNNCGVVHNVFDIGKSEILLGQEIGAIMQKSDIQMMLPETITNILSNYDCDIATWEQTLFYFQNQKYPSRVILNRNSEEGIVSGKCLLISQPGKYQIQPYSRKEVA